MRRGLLLNPLPMRSIISSSASSLCSFPRFQSSSSSMNHATGDDDDLLSILESSIPQSHQHQQSSSSCPPQKSSSTNKKTTPSTASPPPLPHPLVKFQDFDILNPRAAPIPLSYICPPKWVNIVTEVVRDHFRFQLYESKINTFDDDRGDQRIKRNADPSSLAKSVAIKTAPRPELFLQSFVHTSFLRDYERKKMNIGENNSNKTSNAPDDCSMASLAELGSNVLQYSCTVLAPLIPELSGMSNFRNNHSASSSSFNNHHQDYSVFPIQSNFTSQKQLLSKNNSGSSQDKAESKANEHYINFIRDTFASPQTSMSNSRTLQQAVSSDHNVSLVCFNVWKTSDMVLTDAGIYGLRDAMKTSSKEKLKVPPLPMPSAAMNVRAVVGAVYLNFGLEVAVEFCQMHVVSHAVRMMYKASK